MLRLQTLYETRCAALERFVAFTVLFYWLGKDVQDFWRLPIWLGQLKYDMSRTHSIMRVATTASPVSGMEVRDKMLEMQEETLRKRALVVLQVFAAKWLVAQDGVTSTPQRIDRMRLVLLGKYGHETEENKPEEKRPLVRSRRPSATQMPLVKTRRHTAPHMHFGTGRDGTGRDGEISKAATDVDPFQVASGNFMEPRADMPPSMAQSSTFMASVRSMPLKPNGSMAAEVSAASPPAELLQLPLPMAAPVLPNPNPNPNPNPSQR